MYNNPNFTTFFFEGAQGNHTNGDAIDYWGMSASQFAWVITGGLMAFGMIAVLICCPQNLYRGRNHSDGPTTVPFLNDDDNSTHDDSPHDEEGRAVFVLNHKM